jgi:hypothetical protein
MLNGVQFLLLFLGGRNLTGLNLNKQSNTKKKKKNVCIFLVRVWQSPSKVSGSATSLAEFRVVKPPILTNYESCRINLFMVSLH